MLEVRGVAKRFGEQPVLAAMDLAAAHGEVLVLLGRSGSGKTTLLRLIAGFETADAGRILLAGEDVTRLPPARRGVGMVFQHFALFPHLTVADNVAFGLEGRGRPRAEIRRRTDEVLALVELAGFGGRRVDELSGGQQQRVALARALAPEPRLLLLDEPLSNLDPALRERTRRQLAATVRRVGLTALWVTHEQSEAFDVGDRVALLEGGRLAQIGAPRDLYAAPADPFVAEFVGRAGWLAATLEAGGRPLVGGRALPWEVAPVAGAAAGAAVALLLRPEALALADAASAPLAGVVGEARFAGADTLYVVELDGGGRLEVSGEDGAAAPGARVGVALRRPVVVRAYPRPASGAAVVAGERR